VIRICNGTDPNLTRTVLAEAFDPAVMTESPNWGFRAQDGQVVINCQCGEVFDDVGRMVTYPHQPIGQPLADDQLRALLDDLEGGQ
jgi:hypothetical protein